MPETKHFTCNLCEALCGLTLEVQDGRIADLRGDDLDPFSRGHVCPKASGMRELRDDPDRLRTPVRRTAGGWEPLSWDAALDAAAQGLRGVARKHGRHAIGYYLGNPSVHSHRASLGGFFLAAALRTRNRYDANSQDANPRTYASLLLYGDPIAIPVPDVDRTDLFVVFGGNPAVSGGSLMSLGDVRGRMRGIRERGARMIVVDPRRTETAALADQHLFIRPGGDAALILAMLNVLLGEGLVDEQRVRGLATGLDELRAAAQAYPPERVASATGVSAQAIRALAREIAAAKSAAIYGRIGTCQNLFGPVASWLIDALAIVTGNFDRAGGVLFNAPAADLSSLARFVLPQKAGRYRSRVRKLPELMGALPAAVMAEEMETDGEGRVRAFVCMAGNPVLSVPNGARLARALEKLDFMVSVDIYLNETSRHASVVLPPISVLETGNYDLIAPAFAVRNVARYSAPALPRTEGGRDDWEIASELALRFAMPAGGAWMARRLRGLPDAAVDLLLRTGPHKLSLKKLREAPHGLDLGPLQPAGKKRIRTPGHLVRLAPRELMDDLPRLSRWVDERAAATAPLELIGRRHQRSNNSWMHNVPSLAKGPDRSRLLVHPKDAERLGLAEGDAARVRSRTGELSAIVAVSADVMQGVVSLPHGFGHAASAGTLRVAGALPGASVNAITDELAVEPLLGTAVLNGLPVIVERDARAPGALDQ